MYTTFTSRAKNNYGIEVNRGVEGLLFWMLRCVHVFAYQPQNWKGPYMMKELADEVSLIDQLTVKNKYFWIHYQNIYRLLMRT